ncbi:MAG: hypothetical protein HRT74_02085, partial [Flavobacteriales bacterium]|nr:hypothetical protein [Flavobacteriales bacterium]
MKKYSWIFLLFFAIAMGSCSLFQDTSYEAPVMLPEIEVEPEIKYYKASKPKVHDLIHTRLELLPLWQTSQMEGKATLTLSPYFYATNVLQLDAKSMDIHSVLLVTDSTSKDLYFSYDSATIAITLDKKYSRVESFQVEINYTANPEKVVAQGGAAILD